MDRTILKHVMVSNRDEVARPQIIPRQLPSDDFPRRVFVGARRAGKSYMLYQKIQERLASGRTWDDIVYINFEDERLAQFEMADFELILQCHAELSGRRPMLFLDEIQNIDGWEKFARRLADEKYEAWITGSNAKMLSSEIMSSLGGRYLPVEVYPYSFKEYLNAQEIPYDEKALLGLESRAKVMAQWQEYLLWGGLPEAVGLSVKRDYLTSLFQKIYMGDIIARNKIEKDGLLRLMLRKLAQNVTLPISYSKLTHILSSVGGKISTPTVKSFIDYSESAWMLMRLRNIQAPFSVKESECKYYFIDNGILSLSIIDGMSALLENVVAIALFRKYGHDPDNERVFFYNYNKGVDFYIPDDQLAIQVSYSIKLDHDTYEREVGALTALPNVQPCRTRLILTYDETDTINDHYGAIQVIPVWKWLLDQP
ncbi:MAG: ATP-binding protein [Bacteroidales bacterium]|nr:ATP-binding protein [Bacteroidales bacterium]